MSFENNIPDMLENAAVAFRSMSEEAKCLKAELDKASCEIREQGKIINRLKQDNQVRLYCQNDEDITLLLFKTMLNGLYGKAMLNSLCAVPTLSINLNNLSWDEIKHLSDQIPVGATKEVTLKSGETITLRVIGKNHDTCSNGGKAALTWEMTGYMADRHAMNKEYTNAGSWEKCEMRRYLQKKVLPLLPDDLRKALVTVLKETSAGESSQELITTDDSLFLLSEWERYGRKFYAACQEGNWYEWYKQEGVSYAKTYPDGDSGWGWERSPYGSNSTSFCYVNSYGNANYANASTSRGVAFGFCT